MWDSSELEPQGFPVRYVCDICNLRDTEASYLYTHGDSDVISFHIYASWFLPPSCWPTLKLSEMFVTVIALKYALLVSQWSYRLLLKVITDSVLFEQRDKSLPFNSTHYMVLCPQNHDRIVTTDSVTSIHPTYIKNNISCEWSTSSNTSHSTRKRKTSRNKLVANSI